MVYGGYERQREHFQCFRTHMRAVGGYGLPEVPADGIQCLIVCPVRCELRSGFETVSFLFPVERDCVRGEQ